MKYVCLGAYQGSVLIMLTLIFPLLWNLWEIFYPDLAWCFPFFDASIQAFSFSPTEYRCYPVQTIIPFYFPFVAVPIYLRSKTLIPEMVVSIGKAKIDLWSFHIVYNSCLAVDLFLSFSHAPYFRTAFILVGIGLQVKWLIEKG